MIEKSRMVAKMPKIEKVKVNVKERVEDNVCDLSLSELTEVPVREIASFKRVTVLDLSSNRLTTLGKNFTCLTRLTKLDLSKNQIKFLPEDFGLLRNLRHLDLYDNKLEHLPLSLGNITSLRYLDLKGNPLTPALVKIVGHCLTTKDCQNSARNTVKFLAHMQLEAEKAKQKYQEENMTAEQQEEEAAAAVAEEKAKQDENDSAKNNNKKASKKTKGKSKKATNQNNHNEVVVAPSKSETKTAKANKKPNNKSNKSGKSSTTALTSIFVFFLLLAINVLLIYMITYKNPEFADKVVAYIPPHYRSWILTKAEFFRLSVSDWLANFSTPPEDGD